MYGPREAAANARERNEKNRPLPGPERREEPNGHTKGAAAKACSGRGPEEEKKSEVSRVEPVRKKVESVVQCQGQTPES